MYSEIAANKRKTWIIMFVFMALVAVISYFVSLYVFSEPSFTVFIIGFAAVYAAFSYFNAGKMAVALNHAKEIQESDNPRYYRIVDNLAISQGMPTPKVYIVNDPAPNAFATGRDPEHAIVAATTGLIDMMDDSELEGVMAHELGHVKNYDIRVSMIAFALVAAISILSDFMLRSFLWGGSDRRDNGASGILILVAAILAPLSASLLQMAISRKREYLADATGALATRYPEGLASALEKIGKYGSTLQKPNTATAHLFFANPLKASSITKMFSTHPPVEDRIARLTEMGNKL